MTEYLEKAIRFTCEKLTREELIALVVLLTDEGLHAAGRKVKVKDE
jgi:hypothetical protein